jgi:hypothetical protein
MHQNLSPLEVRDLVLNNDLERMGKELVNEQLEVSSPINGKLTPMSFGMMQRKIIDLKRK